jgi:membrane-associated phospholipid phosphatase
MQIRNSTSAIGFPSGHLIGLAIASGLQLLSRQDRRVVVGCTLVVLGLLVLAAKSKG